MSQHDLGGGWIDDTEVGAESCLIETVPYPQTKQ